MRRLIYSLAIILFFLPSCSNKKQKATGSNKQKVALAPIDPVIKEKSSCQMIAKDEYESLKEKFGTKDTLPKVTDFEEAQKLLDGVVYWATTDDDDDSSMIFPQKIKFRSGKELSLFNEDDNYPEWGFIAYYPTEDVLMLEGGHSTDMSYNLTTGEDIDVTGNPDMTSEAPDKTKRVMSYYNGQSSEYFYQVKEGDSYVNKFNFRDYVDDILGFNIDYIVEGFWDNKDTFYFFIPYYNDQGVFIYYMYYKLSVDL